MLELADSGRFDLVLVFGVVNVSVSVEGWEKNAYRNDKFVQTSGTQYFY